MAVDAGRCGSCGLLQGESQAPQLGPLHPVIGRAGPETPLFRSNAHVCVCGAPIAAGAYWCNKCGRSSMALMGVPAEPLATVGRHRARWAELGVCAALAIVMVAVALDFASLGPGGPPNSSRGSDQVAAAGNPTAAGSTTADSPTSLGVVDGSTFAAGPSGAVVTSSPAGPMPTPTGSSAPGATATSTAAASATSGPGDTPGATSGATPAATVPQMFVEITALPDTVSADSSVTLAALTLPGASCTAKVKLHSGKLSLAPGFKKKETADSVGMVAWVWLVETDLGASTATVSCKLKGNSASKDKVTVVI